MAGLRKPCQDHESTPQYFEGSAAGPDGRGWSLQCMASITEELGDAAIDKTTPDHPGAVLLSGRHARRAGHNQSVWHDTRLRGLGGSGQTRGGRP